MHPEEFWEQAQGRNPEAFEESDRDRLLRLIDEGFTDG